MYKVYFVDVWQESETLLLSIGSTTFRRTIIQWISWSLINSRQVSKTQILDLFYTCNRIVIDHFEAYLGMFKAMDCIIINSKDWHHTRLLSLLSKFADCQKNISTSALFNIVYWHLSETSSYEISFRQQQISAILHFTQRESPSLDDFLHPDWTLGRREHS